MSAGEKSSPTLKNESSIGAFMEAACSPDHKYSISTALVPSNTDASSNSVKDEDFTVEDNLTSVPVDGSLSFTSNQSNSFFSPSSSSSLSNLSKSSKSSNTSRQKLYTPQELLMNPQARNLTLAQQLEIVKRYPSRQAQGAGDAMESPMPFSPVRTPLPTESQPSVHIGQEAESTELNQSPNIGNQAYYTVIPVPSLSPVVSPACCEERKCLHYYWQKGIFADDYTHRFSYESTLAHQFTPRFLKLRQNSGTLRNGRVYVAVSERGTEPMLGLFAGENIAKGAVVTMYGGSRRLADAVKAESTEHVSHTRHIPSSMDALDGRPYSLMFDRNSVDMASERLKNPESRTKLFPKFWDEETLRICVDGGVGYMTNTDDKSKHNVKIVDCDVTKVGTAYRELFLVATRDITKDEEIISPYNNRDPAVKRTMELLKQKKMPIVSDDVSNSESIDVTESKTNGEVNNITISDTSSSLIANNSSIATNTTDDQTSESDSSVEILSLKRSREEEEKSDSLSKRPRTTEN